MKTFNIPRDGAVYNLMLRMAKTVGEPALSFDLAAQMRAEGIAWDTTTYGEFIHLALRRADFDACAQLIQRMRSEGPECAPDAETYEHVITAILRKGVPDLDLAQSFFDDMIAHGVAPNEEVVWWLVRTYCASGAFAQGWEVFVRARSLKRGLIFA